MFLVKIWVSQPVLIGRSHSGRANSVECPFLSEVICGESHGRLVVVRVDSLTRRRLLQVGEYGDFQTVKDREVRRGFLFRLYSDRRHGLTVSGGTNILRCVSRNRTVIKTTTHEQSSRRLVKGTKKIVKKLEKDKL